MGAHSRDLLVTRAGIEQAGVTPPTTGKAGVTRAGLVEPRSESELRVLRYLATNLTMQEIAGELNVSVSTVKAHARHLYAKLGSHSRGEAVEQARALRLLAPSARSSGTGAWS